MALETRESTMGGGKGKVHSDEASAQTWAGVVKLPHNALVVESEPADYVRLVGNSSTTFCG